MTKAKELTEDQLKTVQDALTKLAEMETKMAKMQEMEAELTKLKETMKDDASGAKKKASTMEDVYAATVPKDLNDFLQFLSEENKDSAENPHSDMAQFVQGMKVRQGLDPTELLKHDERTVSAIMTSHRGRIQMPSFKSLKDQKNLSTLDAIDAVRRFIRNTLESAGLAPGFLLPRLDAAGKHDKTKSPLYLLADKIDHSVTTEDIVKSVRLVESGSAAIRHSNKVAHRAIMAMLATDFAANIRTKLALHKATKEGEMSLEESGALTYHYVMKALTDVGPEARLAAHMLLVNAKLSDIVGESVDTFINQVRSTVNFCEADGSSLADAARLLFKGLCRSNNEVFVRRLCTRNDAVQGANILKEGQVTTLTFDTLASIALNLYNEMLAEGTWHQTKRTAAAFAAESAPGTTQFQIGNTSDARAGGKGGSKTRDPKYAAPTNGAEEKMIDNVKHLFCSKCGGGKGFWYKESHPKAHRTSEHRSRDRANERKTAGDGTQGKGGKGGKTRTKKAEGASYSTFSFVYPTF